MQMGSAGGDSDAPDRADLRAGGGADARSGGGDGARAGGGDGVRASGGGGARAGDGSGVLAAGSGSGGRTRRVTPGRVFVGALVLVAAVVVVTGILPPASSVALAERVGPVLGFVVAITVVTELAADAGLFSVVSDRLAAWGRGRVWMLWVFVLVLATVSTLFLSLDTTAVLVTPVVVLLALNAGISPIPFAVATVWLANTASLLLPISNLTNLLAAEQMSGGSPAGFVAVVWAPALVGIVVPVVLLSLLFRRRLRGAFTVPAATAVRDRRLLVVAGVVVLVLLPLLVSGLPVWIPATAGAVVLVLAFVLRRRFEPLTWRLVPWSPVAIAAGLFVIVEAAQVHGLSTLVGSVAGSGSSFFALLQLSGLGMLAANGINNLPAYLVLEPAAAGSSVRLAALLIGVNLGPLITPWASLATLLWHQRVTSLGVTVSWPRFMLFGALAVVVTVPLAVLALWLASGTP
ncbi:SLC13 family permease [Subtercola endophyticus]|uniref:SLC13 family permease n=1 Tax=Subtercola endophyticus TaxID=2895559 RepID=UPI001E47F465|nr:SLC13 family permease [Subtercola endophyticus]UFS58396.1 arsenic transporter [Subtercola endophyticus]